MLWRMTQKRVFETSAPLLERLEGSLCNEKVGIVHWVRRLGTSRMWAEYVIGGNSHLFTVISRAKSVKHIQICRAINHHTMA